MGLLPQPFRRSLTSAWGFPPVGGLGFGMPSKQMRTETSGPTSGPVFGFKFYSIRLLTGRPMIATCCGILNFIDMFFGIRLLGRFMFEFEVSPPHLPARLGTQRLANRCLRYFNRVATAQSFCGLRSGFESLPDPFQLHGCGAGLLLCIANLEGFCFDTHT